MLAWRRLICSARYLGVAPWDLATQPGWWQDLAGLMQETDNAADEWAQSQAKP